MDRRPRLPLAAWAAGLVPEPALNLVAMSAALPLPTSLSAASPSPLPRAPFMRSLAPAALRCPPPRGPFLSQATVLRGPAAREEGWRDLLARAESFARAPQTFTSGKPLPLPTAFPPCVQGGATPDTLSVLTAVWSHTGMGDVTRGLRRSLGRVRRSRECARLMEQGALTSEDLDEASDLLEAKTEEYCP